MFVAEGALVRLFGRVMKEGPRLTCVSDTGKSSICDGSLGFDVGAE
jgi:hypothetical protein